MKYKYVIRAGGSYCKGNILYKTNNKQAAYRFAWSLADKGNFPVIRFKGHFEATLIARAVK